MSPGRRGGLIHGRIVAPLLNKKRPIVAPTLGALNRAIAPDCLAVIVIPLFFNQLLRVLQN